MAWYSLVFQRQRYHFETKLVSLILSPREGTLFVECGVICSTLDIRYLDPKIPKAPSSEVFILMSRVYVKCGACTVSFIQV